jgi:hypothetical protein
VALRLALRPITQIVLPHHAEWASHADKHAEMDQHVFEPERAGEAAVDHQPVHADGMAGTRRDCAKR